VVIFINQVRMKIGVMFGNPETTPGGKALKFYSSVRVEIRRITSVKEGESIIGNRVKAKVVKNKVAAPFREAEFDIMFDCGISREADLIDLASEDNIIAKSGTWLSFKDVRLGQGRENARTFLASQPELFEEIRAAVLAKRLATEQATAAAKAAKSAPPPVNGAATKASTTDEKAAPGKDKSPPPPAKTDPNRGKPFVRRT
jgi:recombination protein RecA